MTVGANRLPSHANTQTPTFGDVRVMLKAFERLGFDSAAMIAAAGTAKLLRGETVGVDANADPNWRLAAYERTIVRPRWKT